MIFRCDFFDEVYEIPVNCNGKIFQIGEKFTCMKMINLSATGDHLIIYENSSDDLIYDFFFCTFVILGLLKGARVAKEKLWEQGNKNLTGRSIHLQYINQMMVIICISFRSFLNL